MMTRLHGSVAAVFLASIASACAERALPIEDLRPGVVSDLAVVDAALPDAPLVDLSSSDFPPDFAIPNGPMATHLGLTFTVGDARSGAIRVGVDATSDPYSGDTPPSTSLSVLCLLIDGSPAPPNTGDRNDFSDGWANGRVQLSTPVRGGALTSRATADALCASQFGAGYRMGEFHDGGGGWSWWALGSAPLHVRVWTAIDDQVANPWD